jgi:hypothetical protein
LLGSAIAQESDGAATERQRPDRDQQRQRRENMMDEQRAAALERWQGMPDAGCQTARDKRGARGHGKGGKGGNGQRGGERSPRADTDAA